MSRHRRNSHNRTTLALATCFPGGDQSHFTRSFRHIVGETPSSWRQTRHDAIEERVTALAYPGTTKPIVIEKA
jgi:hypothetical protein